MQREIAPLLNEIVVNNDKLSHCHWKGTGIEKNLSVHYNATQYICYLLLDHISNSMCIIPLSLYAAY